MKRKSNMDLQTAQAASILVRASGARQCLWRTGGGSGVGGAVGEWWAAASVAPAYVCLLCLPAINKPGGVLQLCPLKRAQVEGTRTRGASSVS